MASVNTQLQGRLKSLQAELLAVKDSAASSGHKEAARLSAQDSLVKDLHEVRQQLQARDAVVAQQTARIAELEAAVAMWQKHQAVLLEQVVHAGDSVARGVGGGDSVARGVGGVTAGASWRGDVSILSDNGGAGAAGKSVSRSSASWQQQHKQQPLFSSSTIPPSRVPFATFIALTQVIPPPPAPFNPHLTAN